MRIKVVLAAVVAVVAATGAACTHDPDPSPPPSASPTATPSATPTPPPMPASAQADSPAGAESFARYYMDALDYAYQTGNTSLVRNLASCGGCSAVTKGIDDWHRQGGHYEGGRFSIISSSAIHYSSSGTATVTVRYSRADRTLVSRDGTRDLVKAEFGLTLSFTEARAKSRWLITNIQTVA